MRDAATKGRFPSGALHNWNLHPETRPRGVRHGKHKLTEDDVRAIRSLSGEGMSQKRLAKAYGISQASIQDVIHKRSWTHVC
jgi:predicted DNA-binding protein (UPF0251 family)